MTDTITLPRATVQQALEALEWISTLQTGGMIQVRATEPQAGLRMALEQQAEPVADGLEIKVRRELFRFHSEQEWVNKAQSWYAKCGVRKGHYVTVDALGHVMHMGLCFKNATYPVTCYELQTNWLDQTEAAHGIQESKP